MLICYRKMGEVSVFFSSEAQSCYIQLYYPCDRHIIIEGNADLFFKQNKSERHTAFIRPVGRKKALFFALIRRAK